MRSGLARATLSNILRRNSHLPGTHWEMEHVTESLEPETLKCEDKQMIKGLNQSSQEWSIINQYWKIFCFLYWFCNECSKVRCTPSHPAYYLSQLLIGDQQRNIEHWGKIISTCNVFFLVYYHYQNQRENGFVLSSWQWVDIFPRISPLIE